MPGPVLVPPEPGDDAVGGALVLDLEHRPLARQVRAVQPLGDDAVQAGALEPVEPVRGEGAVPGRGRQVDGRLGAREDLLQPRPALALGHVAEVLVVEREQVPCDEARRALLGEHLHARRGRVDAQQERLELERAVAGDHDLAVEHASLGQVRLERLGELGEVAIERLQVAALDVQLVAVAEHERPEPVPLGLEQPAVVRGQPGARLGQHRLDGWLERESHGPHDTARGNHRPSRCGTTPNRGCGPAAHDPTRGDAGTRDH